MFVILCITIHFQAIKTSIFTKMSNFIRNHLNFSKFSAPAAPNTCHFNLFFQVFSAFTTKKCVTLSQQWPLLLTGVFPIWSLNHTIRLPKICFNPLLPWVFCFGILPRGAKLALPMKTILTLLDTRVLGYAQDTRGGGYNVPHPWKSPFFIQTWTILAQNTQNLISPATFVFMAMSKNHFLDHFCTINLLILLLYRVKRRRVRSDHFWKSSFQTPKSGPKSHFTAFWAKQKLLEIKF